MLTIRELREWGEFFKLEPFGYAAEDARFAVMRQTLIKVMTGNDVEAKDLQLQPEPEEKSDREHAADLARELTAALKRRAPSTAGEKL